MKPETRVSVETNNTYKRARSPVGSGGKAPTDNEQLNMRRNEWKFKVIIIAISR